MNEKVNKRIVFYMTHKEKELLKHYCNNVGLKCSNILRNMTLEMLGKKFRENKKHDVDFLMYLSELSANANNLNQIAKRSNQGQKLMLLDERIIQSQINLISDQIEDLKLRI